MLNGDFKRLGRHSTFSRIAKENFESSNGLCEHLRACEQCVFFCEHELLTNFSCEQLASTLKNTDGERL